MTATHFPEVISHHRRPCRRTTKVDAIRTNERFSFRSERQERKSFVTISQVLREGVAKPGRVVSTRPRGAVVDGWGAPRRQSSDCLGSLAPWQPALSELPTPERKREGVVTMAYRRRHQHRRTRLRFSGLGEVACRLPPRGSKPMALGLVRRVEAL